MAVKSKTLSTSTAFVLDKAQIDRLLSKAYTGKNKTDAAKTGSVTMFCDEKLLGPEIADKLIDFSIKIKRPVVIVDWLNAHTSDYVLNSDKRSFFFLIPNPLAINEQEFPSFKTPVDVKTKVAGHECVLKSYGSQMRSISDERSVFNLQTVDVFEVYNKLETVLLGLVSYRFVKLFHDGFFSCHSTETRDKYCEDLFDSIIAKLGDLLDEETRQSTKLAKEYFNYITSIQKRQADEVYRKLLDKQRDLANQYLAITRIEKESIDLATTHRSLSTRQRSFTKDKLASKKLVEMFKYLLENKFETIELLPDALVANTKMIHITFQNVRYVIGKFRVQIKLNGQVFMSNTTHKRGDYDHPHVIQSTPCLGNIKNDVPKMILAGDLMGTLLLIYDFLSTYNAGGPYHRIEQGWRPEETSGNQAPAVEETDEDDEEDFDEDGDDDGN